MNQSLYIIESSLLGDGTVSQEDFYKWANNLYNNLKNIGAV